MISRTSAERVLNAALATGGDFAELYMEDGESHSISMLDGVVENAAYSRARGAGVRILTRPARATTASTATALQMAPGMLRGASHQMAAARAAEPAHTTTLSRWRARATST